VADSVVQEIDPLLAVPVVDSDGDGVEGRDMGRVDDEEIGVVDSTQVESIQVETTQVESTQIE
jgi:hypothetical protein